jgi:hypothetical protein
MLMSNCSTFLFAMMPHVTKYWPLSGSGLVKNYPKWCNINIFLTFSPNYYWKTFIFDFVYVISLVKQLFNPIPGSRFGQLIPGRGGANLPPLTIFAITQ